MVCLGNICRSPMAEGLLRHKGREQNLGVLVDSAGTANYHIGKAPDARMVQTAQKNGVDIGGLRARQFVLKDFDEFDRIFAMDKENYGHILSLAKNDAQTSKVSLILNDEQNVPDPYYGSLSDFQAVFDILDLATNGIIDNIKHE